MPAREGPPQPAPPTLRGRQILLPGRLQRTLFIAGLVAVVLLGLLLPIALLPIAR